MISLLKSRKDFFYSIVIVAFSHASNASIANVYGDTQTIPSIKVRVQKELKKVLVSGTDLLRKFHIGDEEKVFNGRKAVNFNCHGLSKVKHFPKPILLASLVSKAGLVSLKGEKYRGQIHIVTNPDSSSCDVVQETKLEDYISALLAKEMNASWPVEALKAQAIAARTYALYKMETKQTSKIAGYETHYDLENSEKHQVGGSFFDTNKNTDEASWSTRGLVISSKKNGKIVPAFFHAKCGGRTLRPDNVWQNKVSGYKAVDCPNCDNRGQKHYNTELSRDRFDKFINWAVEKELLTRKALYFIKGDLKIIPDRLYNRNFRFYLDDQPFQVKKTVLRRYFGRVIFPSNNFQIKEHNKKLIVFGKGLGHGVGLCQLGALDMARRGLDYKQILTHYFPDMEIKKIY